MCKSSMDIQLRLKLAFAGRRNHSKLKRYVLKQKSTRKESSVFVKMNLVRIEKFIRNEILISNLPSAASKIISTLI